MVDVYVHELQRKYGILVLIVENNMSERQLRDKWTSITQEN